MQYNVKSHGAMKTRNVLRETFAFGYGEQEWRSGKSARLPPTRPGFNSGPAPYVGSDCCYFRLAPRVFLFSGFPQRNLCLWRAGMKDGAVVRALAFHQCGRGLIPARCHVWVEFVGSRLALRVFLPVYSFPPSTKTNSEHIKFHFGQDRGLA